MSAERARTAASAQLGAAAYRPIGWVTRAGRDGATALGSGPRRRIGSTSQMSPRARGARRGGGRPTRSRRRDGPRRGRGLGEEGRAVLAIAGRGGQTRGVDAARSSAATCGRRGRAGRRGRRSCRPEVRPIGPRTTTTPPVMYSQPCWPRPSTTAWAPDSDGESHPRPPDEVEAATGRAVQARVAGDRLAAGVGGEVRSGATTSRPPDRPLPT